MEEFISGYRGQSLQIKCVVICLVLLAACYVPVFWFHSRFSGDPSRFVEGRDMTAAALFALRRPPGFYAGDIGMPQDSDARRLLLSASTEYEAALGHTGGPIQDHLGRPQPDCRPWCVPFIAINASPRPISPGDRFTITIRDPSGKRLRVTSLPAGHALRLMGDTPFTCRGQVEAAARPLPPHRQTDFLVVFPVPRELPLDSGLVTGGTRQLLEAHPGARFSYRALPLRWEG